MDIDNFKYMINTINKGKVLLFLTGFLFQAGLVWSQSRLEIEISGLRNDKGVLMLQLFNEHQKVVEQKKESIVDNSCKVIIGGLAPGKYGVRFYHDENLSGKLETSLVGKPLEGYGFSNNAQGRFGPPSFEKWLFDLYSDKKISLKTEY